ncbi:MAG: hypothetical protein WC813_02440 [Patescibacteria group bacterium]|jgi:hypothetical protein
MSTPEHGRSGPTYSKTELENIAKEAEKFPKDPKQKPWADLNRRIYLAINSFPAYRKHDGAVLLEKVKEAMKQTTIKESKPSPAKIVTPKPIPRYVEPLRPMTEADKKSLMKDAIANQERMPKDTHNSAAEEEKRKPRKSE